MISLRKKSTDRVQNIEHQREEEKDEEYDEEIHGEKN